MSNTRNDGYLHSGLQAPIRKQQIEAKKEETKPDPKAELVLEEIAKMKTELSNIEHLLFDDSLIPDSRLKKIERMKAQFDILKKLEIRMKKILGVA